MSDRTFIDTNVLIYAHDIDAKGKHEKAKAVLQQLWADRAGVLSTQVLQEFYINATRKLARPLPKQSARLVVNSYATWCMDLSYKEVAAAFGIEDGYRIGFWDALIVAAAVRSGATRVLTEDLHHGQTIAGVRIENPFTANG